MDTKERRLEKNNKRRASPPLFTNGGRRTEATVGYLPEEVEETMRILIYTPATGTDLAFHGYSEYLSTLLQGQTTCLLESSVEDAARLKWLMGSYDLVLCGLPEQSSFVKLLNGSSERHSTRREPATLLVVQQPCWPIRKILLVIRVEASENLAVDWAGRLAHLCDAQLTILPLVSSRALIYGSGNNLRLGIDSLLTTKTPSGEQLRTFLNLLGHWRVNGILRVREGDPQYQIYWEIEDGEYDLVIIGAEQHSRYRRLLFDQLVCPLASQINRPLMIAGRKKPIPPHPRLKPDQKMGDK